MNKQMPFSKGIFCLVVVILVSLLFGAGASQPQIVEAADESSAEAGQVCSTQRVSSFANNTMPVPSACVDGFCKMVIYANDISGAFDKGYSWDVYYYQWTSGNTWIGGPNFEIGGVSFSDGYGENGNGISEAVFGGGSYGDGYIRIMDDGPAENDPNLWTIESMGDAELTSATLTVCSIPGLVDYPNITSSQAIDMPAFCEDNLCMIFRFSFAEFGGMGQGLSMPVYYRQDSGTDLWIGGPNTSVNGIDYSAGAGDNGDGAGMTAIFGGGETAQGGYAMLLDDGAEWSNAQWSVYFNDADDMNSVYYWVAPMICSEIPITSTYTNISRPSYCLDEMCTIVKWTDAQFGIWGPGLSWPVNYKQNSSDNTWIGGPALCMGGACFSQGRGTNGDTSADEIFDSGRTDPNEGYVVLRDDSVTAGETTASWWNVVLNAQDDLTGAAYYLCSNACEETILLVNKSFMPFTQH